LTRFQRLAAVTVVATLALVTIGVVVRITDSGMACPHWPGCFEGQFLPHLDAGFQVWAEWIHRSVAALIGLLVLGLAGLAVLDHRDRASLVWPAVAAVALTGYQAWLGRETVRLGNSGESVLAHLAAAMALLGLLVYLLARAGFAARVASRGGSQRLTILAAFTATATYALLLFGANVTAAGTGLYFADWPLMDGTLLPTLTEGSIAHVLHRWVAAVVAVLVIATWLLARRSRREAPLLARLATASAILYAVQVIVGGAQVLTRLAGWTQTLHVALGAVVWALFVGLAVASYCTARGVVPAGTSGGSGLAGAGRGTGGGDPRGGDRGTPGAAAGPRSRGDSVRAYVALTKPRIIELLLVTTVPAMVLATRELPGIQVVDWAWLTFWTLVGGSLAAGSANAINCYLDRDIDELMARTRRRPLPAHEVEPHRAVVFGIALGVAAFVVMVLFVNLPAAFLTLLAIGFYVVVYTMLLKRTTPQNIVIGGAAGALPPVIGWTAVTGSVGLPAIFLFLLVFYWTPPHFWALSLRIRKDYAAAGVPMLPVVRGIPETTRQIALYTVLLVALSVAFAAVAHMGVLYLATAIALGGVFIVQAWQLWRVGTSEEESTAGAIRLYRYSISYLTLLFVAVALDTLVVIPLA
jgi:protoheme IX farnesyltransferase